MRKAALLVVALAMVASIAMAGETSRGEYVTPITPLTEYLNSNDDIYHSHGYSKYEPKTELGIGADVTVYEFGGGMLDSGFESVVVEGKWDINNKEGGVYGVVKYNLWSQILKILK